MVWWTEFDSWSIVVNCHTTEILLDLKLKSYLSGNFDVFYCETSSRCGKSLFVPLHKSTYENTCSIYLYNICINYLFTATLLRVAQLENYINGKFVYFFVRHVTIIGTIWAKSLNMLSDNTFMIYIYSLILGYIYTERLSWYHNTKAWTWKNSSTKPTKINLTQKCCYREINWCFRIALNEVFIWQLFNT